MRSLILAATFAFSSMSVFANQCDVEFDGKLQFENNVLQVQLDKYNQLEITENRTLYVNNKLISLNSEQQNWINEYYNGIKQAIPQAANIATDAVALASSAINEVFTELLGSDSKIMKDLSQKLSDLDEQIQYNFYAEDGNIRLNSDTFENGKFMGEQWEDEFEETMEELVSESIGHFIITLGSQIIFGGDDMDAFEQKMERFGEQIEHKVEYQAAALEQKAETLCATLENVDFAENKMQDNIPQLRKLDVVQVSKSVNLM